MSLASFAAKRLLATIIVLGATFISPEIASASDLPSRFNVQAQTACEAEMLGSIEAREIFSGKEYQVLSRVARAYGRAVPHIYIFPGSWNMAYIAASAAVDGRGKILVGQLAMNRFHTLALEGFFGHEMAHLVSDDAAEGCDDYVLRDTRMEADADALAARTLGKRPVRDFLEQALVLTEGQNWEVKRRLQILRSRAGMTKGKKSRITRARASRPRDSRRDAGATSSVATFSTTFSMVGIGRWTSRFGAVGATSGRLPVRST